MILAFRSPSLGPWIFAALAILLYIASARAEKMDAEIHNVVIEKLELALKQGDEAVSLKPVRARLADLYADRARMRAMDEAERSCNKCTGAMKDRLKALSLYEVVLGESSKENRGPILLQMAQQHELNGDNKKAEAIFNRIVTEGSKKHGREILAEAYIGRAEARFARGEVMKARADFEAAYRNVGPGRRGAVLQRIAWCHLNLGHQVEAVKTLVRILETPALLERNSSAGVAFDPTFQDDVARDLAVFLARGDITRRDVSLLDSLTPARSKKDVLRRLATECERLGQRAAATDAWAFFLKYESGTEDRLEAMVRIAQIRYDLDQKSEALSILKSALELWAKEGCAGEACKGLHIRIRNLVVAWHKLEKNAPSALLADAYQAYISVFSDDIEMTLWAANVARAQKRYAPAAVLYFKSANLAAQAVGKPNDKKARRWLEASLVGEIEMAELSKDARTREASYDHYIALNPEGQISAKVRYLRARVAYERGDLNEASARFWQFVASKSCNGRVNKEALELCLKAADLDLDALAGLGAHVSVQKRATDYGHVLPMRRNEYARISRTAVMKQAEAMEPQPAIAKLGEADLTGATAAERVRILKMRIAFAERAQDLAETRRSSEFLLRTPGLSDGDREFALGKIAWASEMSFDFETAYAVTGRMKLGMLKRDARALKLAIFAELANRNPRPHVEEFLKVSKNSYQKAQMRAKLVRWSPHPARELARQETHLKAYPGIYAALALEIYGLNKDIRFAERALRIRGVRAEGEGQVLAREIMLREFAMHEATLTRHRLHIGSDRLVAKTLSERLRLLAAHDKFANRVIATRDWPMQVLTLSLAARENRRVHDEILGLPVPAALRGKQREIYAYKVEMNAKGYLAKAEQVERKLQLLWGNEDHQKTLIEDYRTARRTVRPVLAAEIQRVARVAPGGIRQELENELRSDSRPSEPQVLAARREARENPFNQSSLAKLRELEMVRGRETMVAYLDARLLKLQTGGKR